MNSLSKKSSHQKVFLFSVILLFFGFLFHTLNASAACDPKWANKVWRGDYIDGVEKETQPIEYSRESEKQLKKMPKYISEKLAEWVANVESKGLLEVRKIPGYHDEPLKGNRNGERSIRLNQKIRAIYFIKNIDGKDLVYIDEVLGDHDYRPK